MLRVVRVVVANAFPEIAVRLIEAAAAANDVWIGTRAGIAAHVLAQKAS